MEVEVGPLSRKVLKQILDDRHVDAMAYVLTGGHPSEAYVLDDRKSHWVVYYSERGLETGLRRFADEDHACRYLLGLLLSDVSTRRAES
jgi:hypothetical protein